MNSTDDKWTNNRQKKNNKKNNNTCLPDSQHISEFLNSSWKGDWEQQES